MSSCFCPSPRSRLFISSSPSLLPFPPIFVDIYSHFSSPILRAPLSSRASSPTASTPLLRTTYRDCPPAPHTPKRRRRWTLPPLANSTLGCTQVRSASPSPLAVRPAAMHHLPHRLPFLSSSLLYLRTVSGRAGEAPQAALTSAAPSRNRTSAGHLLYKRSCRAFSKSRSLRRTPTKVLHRAATYTALSRPRRIAFRLCRLALTIARQHHPLPPVRAHNRPTSPTSRLTCRAACPYSIAPSSSTRRLCSAYDPHRVLNQRRISLAAFASLALSRLRRNRVSVTTASAYSTLPSARPEFRL
jgi:hypothetical protein